MLDEKMAGVLEEQVRKLSQWAEVTESRIKDIADKQQDLVDKLVRYERQQADDKKQLEGTVRYEIGKVAGNLTELYKNVQTTHGNVQQLIQQFESRVQAVETKADGKGSDHKSLLSTKDMKPTQLDKEEHWRRWRSEVEDYCEEVFPGMKEILDKVRLSETQVQETWFEAAEAKWWSRGEALWRFLKRYTGTRPGESYRASRRIMGTRAGAS